MTIAEMYVEARRSFVEVVDGLTDEQWATPVPCSPEWTVWDVLSHVAGVSDDIVNGRVDGAATDPWTAVQVDRWRDTPRADLIAQWGSQVDRAAEIVQAVDEVRPPLDCHSHEHDVRHALGRPGNRDSELVRWMTGLFGRAPVGRPLDIELADGERLTIDGAGEPLRLGGVTSFDLVRARLGRRSRSQVMAWEWSEPPSAELLREWFVFGPSPHDIDE